MSNEKGEISFVGPVVFSPHGRRLSTSAYLREELKTAWNVPKNFDHALVLHEDDPLLPAILDAYDREGILNGTPTNTMKGPAFKTERCTAYPDCRIPVPTTRSSRR